MRGIRCLLAAVLAAGIVAVVTAQPGGRGFGGGGQDVHTLVFTNAALQEEIKVTPAQKDKIKPIAEKYAALNKARGEMFGKGKGGFDKDKMAEFQEEGKKLAEESKKVYAEVFTSEQKKRLDQITVQVMGVNVFAEPRERKGGGGGGGFGQSEAQKATVKEVADALKLTDAQKTKIKGIMDEHTKDQASISKDVFGETKGKGGKGGGGFDPEKMKDFRTKTSKLSMETMSKIADVLDDTQKTTWKGLVGDAFDTNKLTPVPPKKD